MISRLKWPYGSTESCKPVQSRCLYGYLRSDFVLFRRQGVFDGNVKDVTTVIGTLARLREDFGIKRCIFVGDDGMASEANLAEVARHGYEYITSLSLGRSEMGCKLLDAAPGPKDWEEIQENM